MNKKSAMAACFAARTDEMHFLQLKDTKQSMPSLVFVCKTAKCGEKVNTMRN
jgi:hypothetical protein